MKITIDAFQGQRPRLTPHKLGAYEAQLASNARVDKADLRGWRAPLLVTSLTGTSYRSAFKYKETDLIYEGIATIQIDHLFGGVDRIKKLT